MPEIETTGNLNKECMDPIRTTEADGGVLCACRRRQRERASSDPNLSPRYPVLD